LNSSVSVCLVGDVWKLLKQYYSVFCAGKEDDDKPPSYTLSQFFTEFVSVQDVDMTDSQPASQQGGSASAPSKYARHEILSDSDNDFLLCPSKDPNQERLSDSDDDFVEVVPASPEIHTQDGSSRAETIDADDGMNFSSCSSLSPFGTTKRVRKDSDERPLADLYSEPMRTPTKIGVADFDDEKSGDEAPGLLFRPLQGPRGISPMMSRALADADRMKRLSRFLLEDSDDSDDDKMKGAGGGGSVSKDMGSSKQEASKSTPQEPTIITDEDYRTHFSPSRSIRIPKRHFGSKRKLSMSPTRASFSRQKQEPSPSK